MPVFCTRCGVRNDPDAAFCSDCGTSLTRRPAADVVAQPGMQQAASLPRTFLRPRHFAIGAVLCGLALATGAAFYFYTQPADPTPARLLEAAKAGWTSEELETFRRQLCLANADYRADSFNANTFDQGTQTWFNALVAAGLYQPPVQVQGSGLFSQVLLQYSATPELAKYREGSRLCLAKKVELADVVDIGKSVAHETPKAITVNSKLVLQSRETAPWLTNPEVRAAVLRALQGWAYRDDSLQRQVPGIFGWRDGKWKTGAAYLNELRRAAPGTQRSLEESSRGLGEISLWIKRFTTLFSASGNPLQGTWRISGNRLLGINVPTGLGQNVTFTSNSIEAFGTSTRVTYEIDGKRVKAMPEDGSAGLLFLVESDDTMLFEATGLRYQRVK